MAYEKKDQHPLTEEEIKAYDLYPGYTPLDIKRRYRVSNKIARDIWNMVAKNFGTLPLCKNMVKRERVMEFMKKEQPLVSKNKNKESSL